MSTRRSILAGLAASLVVPSSWAQAQLRSEDARVSGLTPFTPPLPDEFPWRAIDVQPLRLVKMSEAAKRQRSLDLLLEGDLVSQESKARLRHEVEIRAPYHDTITLYARSTRMTFANKNYDGIVVVENVVAVTNASGWRGKSIKKIGWQINDKAKSQIIRYEQAEACRNDFLVVTDYLGVCVRSGRECSKDCKELRLLQV